MTWIKAPGGAPVGSCVRLSASKHGVLSGLVAGPLPLHGSRRCPAMSNVSPVQASAVRSPAVADTYRAFLVAQGGRIVDMVPLKADSEDEARLRALELVGEEDVVELWVGLHAVARFERDTVLRSKA